MDLPITQKELDKIIGILRGSHPHLYAKLWTYKINYLSKNTENGK
jgi:hypothetical protein